MSNRLYPFDQLGRDLARGAAYVLLRIKRELEERWLARTIQQWRPDIIHTLGLEPAGFFYFRVRNRFSLHQFGQWVLQLRGGSDLTLSRLDPQLAPNIGLALRACDQLISDNRQNFEFALELGAKKEQITSLGIVPGTGGVDVASLLQSWKSLPSKRRVILWPKAYECPWSTALPVLESIRLSWDHIQPCEIYMLAMDTQTRMWYWALPEHIRQHCRIKDRMPRAEVLELMGQARVLLAPSLVDGTPNSMYEAMAAGALPILSPLETIRLLVENERNVLFARNLYPQEIADALCRSMTDDALVDSAAERNIDVVRRIADRSQIRPRVIDYYETLVKNARLMKSDRGWK